MNHKTSPDDRNFRESFEALKVSPDDFGHREHVRLAYIYLCEMAVDEAHETMKEALLAFLNHLGVGEVKYHETITRAWIMAVRHFMAGSPGCQSAHAFIDSNPKLLDSKIMLSHYSAEVLFSSEARTRYLEPDIDGIPQH
jgi:hypothetical protein